MNLMMIGRQAQDASRELALLTTEQKNAALLACADAMENHAAEIIAANEKDMANGIEKGMSEGLLDRLKLSETRIHQTAEGVRQVASLPDPVGEVMSEHQHPLGMLVRQVRVPFGVVGIIYESRPNVTADAFSLCLKTGNAVILRGGSDAINSNLAICKALQEGLKTVQINPLSVQVLEDTSRETVNEFMKLKQFVDVLIPRGGAGLIRSVVENSTIPVIETGSGNCHIYVDKEADQEKALNIIVNAKTQRLGVCNACESLVIHEDILTEFLPKLAERLGEKKVEIRADEASRAVCSAFSEATEEDFATEYLDRIISIKTVSDVSEAIEHINRYHTMHSDAIITENQANAEQFLKAVDSAAVYVNASTRFTDGNEFGFGAEIGISTQKLHARGPMGLVALTSYKYQIIGDGQVRP